MIQDSKEEMPFGLTEWPETLDEALHIFWQQISYIFGQSQNINTNDQNATCNVSKIKNPELPVLRVRKIMGTDSYIKQVPKESSFLVTMATELFISELTIRSYYEAKESGTDSITQKEIANVVKKTPLFDFLIDIAEFDFTAMEKEHRDTTKETAMTSTSLQNPNILVKHENLMEDPQELNSPCESTAPKVSEVQNETIVQKSETNVCK